MEKERITYIDAARGIAILAVVLGHTISGTVRTFIYSFHMPLFFILSGMTFHTSLLHACLLSLIVVGICLAAGTILRYHAPFLLGKKR